MGNNKERAGNNINSQEVTVLIKTHEKSFIKKFKIDSIDAGNILSSNPKLHKQGSSSLYDSIVVLQVLPCEDNWILAEIVWKADYQKEKEK